MTITTTTTEELPVLDIPMPPQGVIITKSPATEYRAAAYIVTKTNGLKTRWLKYTPDYGAQWAHYRNQATRFTDHSLRNMMDVPSLEKATVTAIESFLKNNA